MHKNYHAASAGHTADSEDGDGQHIGYGSGYGCDYDDGVR